MKRLLNFPVLLVGLFLGSTACGVKQAAVPIVFGKDQCAFCKMTISNPQFGAELITDKGRILKYDAAECMVNHLNDQAPKHQKLYVVPYDQPGELRAVAQVEFLISPDFRSPMGANLAAFADKKNVAEKEQGHLIDWQTLRQSPLLPSPSPSP